MKKAKKGRGRKLMEASEEISYTEKPDTEEIGCTEIEADCFPNREQADDKNIISVVKLF